MTHLKPTKFKMAPTDYQFNAMRGAWPQGTRPFFFFALLVAEKKADEPLSDRSGFGRNTR
jgi:hypothetical protein